MHFCSANTLADSGNITADSVLKPDRTKHTAKIPDRNYDTSSLLAYK